MHDWNARELKQSAVEYALRTCGDPPPRSAAGETAARYRARLTACAVALGMEGDAQLWQWMHDPRIRPSWDKGERHTAPHGRDGRPAVLLAEEFGQDTAAALDARAAALPEIAPGVLPSAAPDPLAALLEEEHGVLSERERAAMAAALERGDPLGRQERLALAMQLRGSCLATRREVVRAVLDYISPPGDGSVTHIWRAREIELPLPPGGSWEHLELRQSVVPEWSGGRNGGAKIGRTLLVIRDASGAVVRALPYTLVRRLRQRSGRSGPVLGAFRLQPEETFARDLVLRQFALLASMVRGDGRTGKGWARLFGETKAATSYNRKRLDERVRADSGSAAGFRGLRAKPDPRKGRRLKPEEQEQRTAAGEE